MSGFDRGNPQDALIARRESACLRRFLVDGLPLAGRRMITFKMQGERPPQDPKAFAFKVGTLIRANTPGSPSQPGRLRSTRPW